MYLEGKHILVGISGGIAAYKIPDLIRRYVKCGAEVRCVATRNALNFVTPLTLETVSQNAVYTDVFHSPETRTTAHISLADWADVFVVAPATANVIGKMAAGIGDDALTTQMLAFRGPALIVPAMNEGMWNNPIVQRNIGILRDTAGMTIMLPAAGELACGTCGTGRMPEPQEILTATNDMLAPQDLTGKSILITAGPTQELIDPVRYISNFSTGKMGYALADECRARGARVTIVSGPVSTTAQHGDINIIPVTSAKQMYKAAMHEQQENSYDGVILCAAVADYLPSKTCDKKIKRNDDSVTLELSATEDIARAIGQNKREGQWLLGFALETDNEQANAQKKLESKNLDYIVLNSLNDDQAGFGYDTNKVTLLSRSGNKAVLPLMDKRSVARKIMDYVLGLCMALLLFVMPLNTTAQELNCRVTINSDQIQGSNKQVFNTLQNSISEFLNNRRFTNQTVTQQEQIESNMLIVVNGYDQSTNMFSCEMTLQSRRPVFETSYTTTILNHKDNQFNFQYAEFDQLEFQPNTFTSNLTALLTFYAYLIIGFDADSYSPMGGSPYFQLCETIVTNAQSASIEGSEMKGWKAFADHRNRYAVINNLMDDAFKPFRLFMYQYHRLGLDMMSGNVANGRAEIASNIETLRKVNRARPQTALVALFLDAKSDELADIFAKGTADEKRNVYQILMDVDPTRSNTYDRINSN